MQKKMKLFSRLFTLMMIAFAVVFWVAGSRSKAEAQKGNLQISIQFEGPITQSGKEKIRFVVKDLSENIIWEGKLGDTTKFTAGDDGFYRSELIALDSTKIYTVDQSDFDVIGPVETVWYWYNDPEHKNYPTVSVLAREVKVEAGTTNTIEYKNFYIVGGVVTVHSVRGPISEEQRLSVGTELTDENGNVVFSGCLGDKLKYNHLYTWSYETTNLPMEDGMTYTFTAKVPDIEGFKHTTTYSIDGYDQVPGTEVSGLTGSPDKCRIVYFRTTYSFDDPEPEQADDAVAEIFEDVSKTAWYRPFIQYVYDHGIMSGKGESTTTPDKKIFDPNASITRAEFATMLYNLHGRPEVEFEDAFHDVQDGKWYTKPVIWLKQQDIVAGYPNGNFGVSDPITREQIALILYKYAKNQELDTGYFIGALDSAVDRLQISSWAKEAIAWARTKSIMVGSAYDNPTLNPKGNATRAEVAAMIRNYDSVFEIKRQ